MSEAAPAPDPCRVVLITKNEADLPPWVAPAAAAAGLVLTVRRCETREELLQHAGEAAVIWTVGANTCLTAEVLPLLPKCRALMRSGSGLDDLPVEAARERGMVVANTPEAIAETVAEHTVALILGLVRQVARFDRSVRAGAWCSGPDPGLGHLSGQTLGLLGFGLIARHVARMLQGFRLRLMVHDPYAPEAVLREHGAEAVSFDTLLREADVLSLHCPLTAETRGSINAAAFARMKPGALLVNTSRGGVIDEAALIDALRAGRIAGAGLDVLEAEPPPPGHPLLAMEQVILSPHLAAFADVFEVRFWNASIQKLRDLTTQLSSSPNRKQTNTP